MFIRKKSSPHDPKKISVQIVESVRNGKKVSQNIVRHVGTAFNDDELNAITALAESIMKQMEEVKSNNLPLFEPDQLAPRYAFDNDHDDEALPVDLKKIAEEQRFNQGIVDVFGKLFDLLEFNTIFSGRFAKTNNDILKSLVLARIANSSSKNRSSELLESDFAIRLPVDKIYRMMDQLSDQHSRLHELVLASTKNLFREKIEILFFDVTTLYFESFDADELRNFGFSKDCKFKETQIVFALITTVKGLPITFKAFPGNINEMKTLIPVIEDLKKQFDVEKINFAADRGMFTEENLKKLEDIGVKYVVAAKLRSMDKKTKEQILNFSRNNLERKYSVNELEVKDRRLVIEYSPKRASKDKKDRERLVERLEKIKNKNGRIDLDKLINNNGTKKFLKISKNAKTGKEGEINYEKIKADEEWDGISGYVTNSDQPSHKVLEQYRNLWVIEESFRIQKHDLKVRPIFHFKPEKILAHLDICFLTYALVRQIMYRYELRHKESISFEIIRNELLKVQASVLYDRKNNTRYILPSKMSATARELYSAVGLSRKTTPYRFQQRPH